MSEVSEIDDVLREWELDNVLDVLFVGYDDHAEIEKIWMTNSSDGFCGDLDMSLAADLLRYVSSIGDRRGFTDGGCGDLYDPPEDGQYCCDDLCEEEVIEFLEDEIELDREEVGPWYVKGLHSYPGIKSKYISQYSWVNPHQLYAYELGYELAEQIKWEK